VPTTFSEVTPERATTYHEDKKLAKFAKQLLSPHRALRGLRGLSDKAVGRLSRGPFHSYRSQILNCCQIVRLARIPKNPADHTIAAARYDRILIASGSPLRLRTNSKPE
jgi:hypothetical protein